MSARLRMVSMATLVTALPLLTSCGGDSDPAAGPSPSASAPSSPASAEPSAAAPSDPAPSPTATGMAARAVYFLNDTGRGPRLYREFHRRPATSQVVRDAVEAMLTTSARDEDYTSLWPEATKVLGVRLDGKTATVDLSAAARTAKAGAAAEAASLQQLVYTVTAAAPYLDAVQLEVEGKVVADLWGHVDTTKPLRRELAAQVLGPVWITQPESGRLARGADFGGEASVFEATVSWELLRDGVVVKKGFSTAAEGAPGRGSWAGQADVPPGDYVLRAFESSAEDGRPTFVEDKPLTVTP